VRQSARTLAALPPAFKQANHNVNSVLQTKMTRDLSSRIMGRLIEIIDAESKNISFLRYFCHP
jgi:hypothetical protein